MANPLLVNVAEITRRAGSEKDIVLSVPVEHFTFEDERISSREVPVDLHLESVNGGIAVTGTAQTAWRGECRRCLKPVEGIALAQVHELYQQNITDPEAYQILGEQLDLTPMVRELVLLEIPVSPLCKEDCPGLCPNCGADLSVEACGCLPVEKESPWGALSALKDQLGGGE